MQDLIEGVDPEDIKEEMSEIGLLKVLSDTVSKLPDGAVTLASSMTSHNEMWTIDDRVLCIMSSPEYNTTFIKELIINKLYEAG